MELKSKYIPTSIPLCEYPRPQLKRDSYKCLNGEWNFAKYKKTETVYTFTQKILVPFSPETELSGIEKGFKLEKDEKLVYEREIEIETEFLKAKTLLHFGAVDQTCKVYCNGEEVCAHVGGYTPFCADVSQQIKVGKNVIRVECEDGTESTEYTRGKQSSKRGQIWYTAQSGIWQTVWMESVVEGAIERIKITPDVDKGCVTIQTFENSRKKITVYDGGKNLFEREFTGDTIELCEDFSLWSPENPKLYDFTIETEAGDTIQSYFGMRSFGIGKDTQGNARLLLNGKPYFLSGILDQGYWPEGLLTHPSDEAIVDELTMLKEMGFTMVRKHIKVEPLRWYYHCDRLGLVVWQDFVNGGGDYKFTHVAMMPFLGFKHRDSDYKYFAREREEGRQEFLSTAKETVETLYNCVSIGAWVPFNEGWGQFDSEEITKTLKTWDDTRVIDSVSGWHDQGVGKTELKSLHTYYTRLKVPKDSRPVVLSEFGGYSMQTAGHVFSPDKEFGYKKFKTQEKLCEALKKLYFKKLKPLIKKGLCACVYTQVSDVEEEINGLVTYDRKVVKVPKEFMRTLNEALKTEINE